MNLDSDGMDDIISQESPLDMEGNYKKVRGRALLFVNNQTIFLTGRMITLEEWPDSTLSGHCHNIFKKAPCTESNALSWESTSFCFFQLVFINIL